MRVVLIPYPLPESFEVFLVRHYNFVLFLLCVELSVPRVPASIRKCSSEKRHQDYSVVFVNVPGTFKSHVMIELYSLLSISPSWGDVTP